MCEAVCVMFGLKAVKVPDPDDPTKKIWDFWPTSQKMMSDSDFINKLKTYDKVFFSLIPYSLSLHSLFFIIIT